MRCPPSRTSWTPPITLAAPTRTTRAAATATAEGTLPAADARRPRMSPLLSRYTRWLHTRWPAGLVEKLPVVGPGGATNVPGVRVTGDLTGIPLLKFATDTGARAVQAIVAEPAFARRRQATGADAPFDLIVIGGGVSGMAAALEARSQGLTCCVLEGSEPFSTVVNFPRGKPIFTYPTQMVPAGDLHVTAQVKEPLVDELRAQTIARGLTPRPA